MGIWGMGPQLWGLISLSPPPEGGLDLVTNRLGAI